MSMWLTLAKVTPDLLLEIRARPDLLDDLFFEEDAELPTGFDPRSDVFGCDYRTLSMIAEGMAEQEEPGSDWREKYVWLRRATGEDERDQLSGYEFTYGPAFALVPDEVQSVHNGLAEEGWVLDDTDVSDDDLRAAGLDPADDDLLSDDDDDMGDEDDDELDDEDDGSDDEPDYDDFQDLLPFFAAAAREGKAIVGGVS